MYAIRSYYEVIDWYYWWWVIHLCRITSYNVCYTKLLRIETADVALIAEDLRRVPEAVVLGRRMVAVIRQNVVASLAIKAGFLVAAVAGVATLWMAVVADMGTTLLVIRITSYNVCYTKLLRISPLPFREDTVAPRPESRFPRADGTRAGNRIEGIPRQGENGRAGRLVPLLRKDPWPRELRQEKEEIPGRSFHSPFSYNFV